MAIPKPTYDDFIKDYDEMQTDEKNEIVDVVNDHSNKLLDLLTRLGLIADYVIETGQNANGSYEKWHSGKLVQTGKIEVDLGSFSDITMTGIYRTTPTNPSFPIPFVGTPPFVTKNLIRITGQNGWEIKNDLPTLTNMGAIMLARSVQDATNVRAVLFYDATGRWK